MDDDDDQRAYKPQILSLMMTARHSGTETNRVSTNWFIQRLEHLSCLQQVLQLSVFLAMVVLFLIPHRARMFDSLLSRLMCLSATSRCYHNID